MFLHMIPLSLFLETPVVGNISYVSGDGIWKTLNIGRSYRSLINMSFDCYCIISYHSTLYLLLVSFSVVAHLNYTDVVVHNPYENYCLIKSYQVSHI
jgi:hypothetical protein